MQPSVGVIIPVYNRADGAAVAAASALAQSFPTEQVVVVDDGSDPPVELPPDVSGDPRASLIRLKENSGASAARQAGLEAIRTSHVAFLDSDDLWAPSKLATQVKLLESLDDPERVAVSCGWEWVDRPRAPLVRQPRASAALSDFVAGCWFCPGSTVLMAVAALNGIGGFDRTLRRLEDLDLFIRFAKAGGRLEVVPSVEATIRRGRNATRKDIDGAAARLRAKYAQTGEEPLAADLYRRLDAWLAVEEAAAARNEGQYARMAARLAYSFWRVPRAQLQFGNWWR